MTDQPPPPAPSLALSVPEAAASLGIAKSTFYAWVKAGEISVSKIRGRTLVRRADVEALLDRRAA